MYADYDSYDMMAALIGTGVFTVYMMENLHKGRQARLGKSYTLLYAVLPLRYCLGYWLVIPAWFCAYCKHCSWHHGKL